jgi:hypothetical protein
MLGHSVMDCFVKVDAEAQLEQAEKRKKAPPTGSG